MLDKKLSFWHAHKDVLKWYLLILLCLILFSSLIVYAVPEEISKGSSSHGNQIEITDIYYFLGIAVSLLISMIALINLSSISKNTKAEFLLRIDERWGSTEIIRARSIIHKYYIQTRNMHKNDPIPISKKTLHLEIATEILKLHESDKKIDQEDFAYLLNFLDFMETIGYFYSNGYLELKALQELCALSIIFNYEIFEKIIEHKREIQSNDFYASFKELYCAIKNY